MLKIAIGQFKVQPGHPDKNTEKMLQMISEAKSSDAQIIAFPELSISGYLLGDTWEQSSFLRDCEEYGKEIIAASQGICVIFGNVAIDWDKKNNDGRPRKYNAVFVAKDGKLLKSHSQPYPFIIKSLMPNYREFDETRHFFSLQQLALEMGTEASQMIDPITIEINGRPLRVGTLLCEDSWSDDYSLSPVKVLAEKGVDLLMNISSSPYTLGKNGKRHRVFGQQAKALGVPLFYVNNIGIQNNGKTVYTFDGSSTVYSPNGHMVAYCEKYVEEIRCVDLETIDQLPDAAREKKSDIAHIYDALFYGVKNFLADINMNKVVIGVSGGIDSAVSAALYAKILGPENVLLINMPSVFNSATTRGLAQKLAENLGCKYAIIPIQKSVDHSIAQFESTDITQLATGEISHLNISSFVTENIQARDRSSRILAGVAAAFGGGFTCNANKAETTVGYSTLYGDQSGFLCALADLWKFQVYDLARYLNEAVYGREVVPQASIDIVPSAELSNAQCVDEGKGDPIKYPYHDYLFRSFIERWNKATPEDVLQWYKDGTLEENIGCEKGLVDKYFSNAQEFIIDLERWWKQFCGMSVAKRIQAPPVMAVSRRAYGFDHRESQNGIYYTRRYRQLKDELLNK